MYADSGLMLSYMQNYSPDIQQFEDLFKSYKLSDAEMVRIFILHFVFPLSMSSFQESSSSFTWDDYSFFWVDL